MQLIKVIVTALSVAYASSSFADPTCEATAKTKDDFLACTAGDIKSTLDKADTLFNHLIKSVAHIKALKLQANHQLWQQRIKSDCEIVGDAFNDWANDYTPDTDYQVAACKLNIARQELLFYKQLSCPDDMETSPAPKCETLQKILGTGAAAK